MVILPFKKNSYGLYFESNIAINSFKKKHTNKFLMIFEKIKKQTEGKNVISLKYFNGGY